MNSYDSQLLDLYPDLFKLASQWMRGDRSLAEDMVQEAIARALKARDRYDPVHPFRKWMIHILKCVKWDYFRSWSYRNFAPITAEDEEVLMGIMMAPDDQHADLEVKEFLKSLTPAEMDQMHGFFDGNPKVTRELTRKIEEFRGLTKTVKERPELDFLPPSERQAMSMLMDGFNSGGIARELGITPGAARLRIMKARKKIEERKKDGEVQGSSEGDGQVAGRPIRTVRDQSGSRELPVHVPVLVAAG